jgi:hypothetical protein
MGILTEKKTWRRNPEPSWARRSNFLTPTERDNVRRAVIYLCGRYPTRAAQIAALGLSNDAIAKARSKARVQTYRLACVVSRVAGVPVEKILTGLWPGDRCPHCGGTGKASQIVAVGLIAKP